MNGVEKLIMVMRKEGGRSNPPPLVLGEMSAPKKCNIKGMEFEGDDLYFAEHLLQHDRKMSISGVKTQGTSGGTDAEAFAFHTHDIEIDKKKVTIETTLKKGDLVLCYRVSDDKYVIIEKVVSG